MLRDMVSTPLIVTTTVGSSTIRCDEYDVDQDASGMDVK